MQEKYKSMNKVPNKSSNIPKLRFKEFTDEWEVRKLGNLLEFKNGINASKEQYGKGVKFINVLDILNNDFITCENIVGRVDVDNITVEKFSVKYGDILFQRSSETREEVGTANVYLDKENTATFGGFVIRGRKIGDYEPIFFNKILKTDSARDSITSKSGGSTRFNVGQEILSSIALHFPNLIEQQKIANFLSLIDERIATQSKIIEELNVLKSSISKKIFTQKLRFKDDDGNKFLDWEVRRLGECLDYIQPTKYLVSSTEYDNSYKTPVLTAGKTFILGYTNETNGIFENNLPVIIFDDFTTATQFVDFPFKAKSSAMKILVATKGVHIKFIFEAMQFMSYEIGGHERHWISKFVPIEILVPSLDEQTKIANFLLGIDEKIKTENQILEQYQNQKKYLLSNLFI